MAKDAEKLAAQGERIRELRRFARVSQEVAASAVGVTLRGYQRWERGEGEINPDNIRKLAAYYGTTPDYIEYGTVKRDRTPDLSNGDATAAQLAALTQTVSELAAQLAELRGDTAATAVEVMRLLDERLPPSAAPRRRRQA